MQSSGLAYPIVDSGQIYCYDDGASVACPTEGEGFFGQDAQYSGNQPSYVDNGDGTVADLVTGLMWQQDPGEKMTYSEAVAGADNFSLAGYDDWRLPTIKELYSLILFSGYDPSGPDASSLVPFIDTDYFVFEYGDESDGERIIDSQFISSTEYVSTTMNGARTVFGVNFADGRIKGYGTEAMRGQSEGKGFFVLYVRGNSEYGENDFINNGNGTITDAATGLTWMQDDNGSGMDWEEALNYCENLDYAGYDDWRLPNAKELQSIVDYSRSPDTSNSAAIDPLFGVSSITNEAGQTDYPAYWSSTTHANRRGGMNAAYVNFGRSMGYMNGTWMDVHGAGAQRSDPKSGDAANYPTGHGPQGDAIRIENYVRCVQGGTSGDVVVSGEIDSSINDSTLPPVGDNRQAGIGGEPPQEAINACVGSSTGAACTINTPNGTLDGTCTNIQSELACVPEGGRPNGGQQPPAGGGRP
ncbi:MAG: DUF1566 domain-containing protein [Chloroflexi bacterium]|nr:MAG: DUF1566 domain-containing protein [Chloroflexota bacterium]MBL1196835.1 DUF1566 domain-containing protein [Chloroflexota bacterium]NOH14130.1 DUF1566 domain-containing protein [Chloroflexota bacterium]